MFSLILTLVAAPLFGLAVCYAVEQGRKAALKADRWLEERCA